MKVALVCDWITGYGGGERVVYEIHKLYPDAPIYTSQQAKLDNLWSKDADVRTSWLQRLPFSWRKFLVVPRAWTFSRLDLSDYDLVISIGSNESKAVKTGPNTIHIFYCHAATHFYWSRYEEYMKHPGFDKLDFLARFGLRLLVSPMRRWDKRMTKRPDYIIANSTFTQSEIKKYYDRDSTVIHPPVDISRFKPSKKYPRKGFIIWGRQTPYKRFDLAVRAATKLKVPLTVIGKGPDNPRLVKLAGSTVKFLDEVSDSELPRYVQSAKAMLFPGWDDFGIAAVEALAAGTPVIAFAKGGALDYVIPGKTGLLFKPQSLDMLVRAIRNFDSDKFSELTVSKQAANYTLPIFKKNLEAFISACLLVTT